MEKLELKPRIAYGPPRVAITGRDRRRAEDAAEVVIEDDGWTAVTKDGSLSAHFEHSVAITENGPFVLSRNSA